MAVCVDKCDVSCTDASPDGVNSGPEENPSVVWFWIRLLLGSFKEDLCFFSVAFLLVGECEKCVRWQDVRLCSDAPKAWHTSWYREYRNEQGMLLNTVGCGAP